MTTKAEAEKVRWDQVPVPHTTVSVYEALHRRRMAWKFKDTAVPRAALERMLAAAIWAPNHHLTEPWRFYIMEKNSPLRRKLAQVAYDGMLAQLGNERRAETYRREVLDPPVLAYTCYMDGKDEQETRENYAATVCAMYAMGLAGHAEGLSVTFETGGVTKVPGLQQALGAEPGANILATLSIGFPDEASGSSRTPVGRFVHWG